ncbi:hypothetical protein [Streptomyces sp. TRM68367]|uniref:DUF7739 domain-containing protein n=1 Tax=Streptomyces sp. TRM68367 TaxID=2758415 RepID=UPI00165BB6CB|nr:hypothetical protein [Streptomyces sp. TRM68367]MBC9729310.1 hypothetical protein [Streptomyces sp. TRM68367]
MSSWSISHGTSEGGRLHCAYGSTAVLARHLAHVLSAADWRSIKWVFDRPRGAPFAVADTAASRIADVLYRACGHELMPEVWAVMAYDLAVTADRAAGSREPWTWT